MFISVPSSTMRIASGLLAAVAITSASSLDFASAPGPVVEAFSTTCESLATLTLANGRITSASLVSPGSFTPPGAAGRAGASSPYAALPSFCRVEATLTPTADSDMRIEVWLPASDWNGKLQAVGNGGWAGTVWSARARLRGRARLRDGQHGHGALHSRCRVCDESPREDGGLRAPCRARDDHAGEGARVGILRKRAQALDVEWMLDRRPSGRD